MGMTRAEESAAVQKFMPLVYKIARKWAAVSAVPEEDLIQEGAIGVLAALRKWSPDGGASVLSYCYTWVDAKIRRAVRKQGGRYERSFDAENEDGETLHERIASREPSPEEIFARREGIADALRKLSARELEIIHDRYSNDLTMEEVGQGQGLTRQRIHQIETEALTRLGKSLRHVR